MAGTDETNGADGADETGAGGAGVSPERAEIVALRARIAVLERLAWLGVVMSAQLKRGATLAYLEAKRAEMAERLGEVQGAGDLQDPAERALMIEKVDAAFRRIMAAVEEI